MDKRERIELTKSVRVTNDVLDRIGNATLPWRHGPFDKAKAPALQLAIETELGAPVVGFEDVTTPLLEEHAPGIRCYRFKLGERNLEVNVGEMDLDKARAAAGG